MIMYSILKQKDLLSVLPTVYSHIELSNELVLYAKIDTDKEFLYIKLANDRVVSLPFEYFKNFYIEKEDFIKCKIIEYGKILKFGTVKIFIKDILKNLNLLEVL